MLVWLAWTDPPAPSRYVPTGWDNCPASLAPLASLALKVLLKAFLIYQSVEYIKVSVIKNIRPFIYVMLVVKFSSDANVR